MKKIVVLLTLVTLSFTANAVNRTWNFSDWTVKTADPYSQVCTDTVINGLTLNIPTGNPSVTPSTYFYGYIDNFALTFGGTSFTKKFFTATPTDQTFTIMPTYAHFTFDVAAGDTVKVYFTSGGATARNCYITDGTTIIAQASSANTTTGVVFSGVFTSSGTAYVFSNNSIQFYQIKVNSLVSGITDGISSSLLKKVGDELVNPTNLKVEVYSVMGVKVLSSSEPSISLSGLAHGVYVANTTQGTLKFVK